MTQNMYEKNDYAELCKSTNLYKESFQNIIVNI